MVEHSLFGRPENTYKDIYEKYKKLYKLHDTLLRSIKNNESIKDVTVKSLEYLEKISWNLRYHLASGIGLEDDELPKLSINSNDVFLENMVINLKPQVYIGDSYGLLIQDTIGISKTSFKIYTKLDRDIEDITL